MMGLTEMVRHFVRRPEERLRLDSDRVALDEASLPPFKRVLDELTRLEDLMKRERRTT